MIKVNWFLKKWHLVGGCLGLVLLATLLSWQPTLSGLQFWLIANLLALFAHQVEEYQLPGGAPLVINRVVYREKEQPDRYPGNACSIMVVNVTAWLVYGLAILLPHCYWLGVGVIFFSLFQILGHLFEMNLVLRVWYNPGLATTITLFPLVGWGYLHRLAQQHLLTAATLAGGGLVLLACILGTIVLPVQVLKDRATRWVIDPRQVAAFRRVMAHCRFGQRGVAK